MGNRRNTGKSSNKRNKKLSEKSKDVYAREFFADHERYADIINGLICDGRQIVTKGDLQILDSRTGTKCRDLVRLVSFEGNLAVVGIENQDYIDYAMPQRVMMYESGEYDCQIAQIKRKHRRSKTKTTRNEYMGRIHKGDCLDPTVTLVLYYAAESWDGEKELLGILNSTGIPEKFRKMVQNYEIHIIEIRKLEDTSMFQTDVKQVFDFIRYASDKEKLEELVRREPAFHEMERDAFEFISHYVKASSLRECQEYKREGDTVNMCRALEEIFNDGVTKGEAAGKIEGKEEEKKDTILRALASEFSVEQIMFICDCTADYVEQVRMGT